MEGINFFTAFCLVTYFFVSLYFITKGDRNRSRRSLKKGIPLASALSLFFLFSTPGFGILLFLLFCIAGSVILTGMLYGVDYCLTP